MSFSVYPDDLLGELRQRWRTLASGLGIDPHVATPIGEKLLRAWNRWPRRYHDLRHLQACLRAADAVSSQAQQPAAIAWALWFHDAVYWPWSKENERRSADWARDAARLCGLGSGFGATVHQLVMATAHGAGAAPAEGDAALVIDIDLGILGQKPEIYDRYAQAVRREFFWVRSGDWRRGRAAVLRHFMERPRLFVSEHFFTLLENQARENLARELASLSGTPKEAT